MSSRYGFSDFISDQTPSKYMNVTNKDGVVIGEVECYFIEDELDEEE